MGRSEISRRSVLASLSAAPMASVLAKSATGDSLHSVKSELVFSALLQLRLAAPANALSGSATIMGGEASGPLVAQVQPGSFSWTRDSARGVLQLVTRFDLQTQDGQRLQVSDLGTAEISSLDCWEAPISTLTELTLLEGSPAVSYEAVYLGRLNASQIHGGELRLDVHRVL
jgi:hypothetical protein